MTGKWSVSKYLIVLHSTSSTAFCILVLARQKSICANYVGSNLVSNPVISLQLTCLSTAFWKDVFTTVVSVASNVSLSSALL